MKNNRLTVLNQAFQVFVYEDSEDAVNREQNGTLKLLKHLPHERPPT